MHSQIDNSRERYNQIWRPHQSLVNYFVENHAPTTENLLKLLQTIRRNDYGLSFTFNRDPNMLAAMD